MSAGAGSAPAFCTARSPAARSSRLCGTPSAPSTSIRNMRAAEEHHDVPRAGRARPRVGVGAADGVLLRAGDPGGGEQELVLHHRLRRAALHDRRDELLVELPLVVDGAGDEAGRPLDLDSLRRGVPEEEEEVGVERDPVAAAQVAVRPEGVEPAVHARRRRRTAPAPRAASGRGRRGGGRRPPPPRSPPARRRSAAARTRRGTARSSPPAWAAAPAAGCPLGRRSSWLLAFPDGYSILLSIRVVGPVMSLVHTRAVTHRARSSWSAERATVKATARPRLR